MRETRAANALVLALLLALPLAWAQTAPQAWDEVAGGAARTGAAFLPATTLDVLESRDLFGDELAINLLYSKGLVSTPHGLLAVATEGDGSCVLLRITSDVERLPLDGCAFGTLQAYDRANDRILICSQGGAEHEVLQSRNAGGELVWGVTPTMSGQGAAAAPRWTCRGVAIGPDGSAYAALWGEPTDPTGTVSTPSTAAVLFRVRVDNGEIEWDRSLSATDLYALSGVDVVVDEPTGSAGFEPFGLSLTSGGIVVSGRATCACSKSDPLQAARAAVFGPPRLVQGAVAWLDLEGDLVGSALAEDDAVTEEGEPGARRFHPWWAATQGPLAGFALGDRVMLVNPTEREPRAAPFEPIETGRNFIGVVPSAWWSNFLLVPVAKSVTAIDAHTLVNEWSRVIGEGDQWILSGMIMLPPSDVLVLVASSEGFVANPIDTPARIHRLDLETGNEVQRIDLPGTIRMTGGTGRVGFQPLDDGRLLIYSLDGRLFTLGTADPSLRPPVSISNAYPAPSEGVTLVVEPPDPTAMYSIAWGDGAVETNGTSWTHRFGDAQPHTARVTARFADDRTATTETVIRVGEAPPPDLNALQVAFSDKWQNVTFGVLGLLLTVAGGAFAVLARRQRHSRLHDELMALERIREQGRRDVEGAIRALGIYRERLLAEVAARRLNDAQLNTLEARANVVFSALRTRLLGPLAGRLSADFRHALDVVLHDGRIDPTELASLEGALHAERQLTADEQARLRGLMLHMAGGPGSVQ